MKVCPQCDRAFEDDTLRFCLMDGTPLVEGNSLPTVTISPRSTQEQTLVMPTETVTRPSVPSRKQKSKAPWIIAASLLMLALIGVSGWLLAELAYQGRMSRANRNTANPETVRNTPSPVRTQQATPAPTGTPEPASANTAPVDEAAGEFTPILWTTDALTFNTEAGRTYRFECPAGGSGRVIWGSDVYTTGSSICTAAVHAGVITMEGGGEVTIEMQPGRAVYAGTARNGITSNPSGEYPSSFVFRKADPQKKN